MIRPLRFLVLPAVFLGLILAASPSPRAGGCNLTNPITYDLPSRLLTNSPKCVKDGQSVTLVITGVNPFLYTGTVNGKNIERHVGSIPSVVQTNVLGTATPSDSPAGDAGSRFNREARTKDRFTNGTEAFSKFDLYRKDFLSKLHDLTSKTAIEASLADFVHSSNGLDLQTIQTRGQGIANSFLSGVDAAILIQSAQRLFAEVEAAYHDAMSHYRQFNAVADAERQALALEIQAMRSKEVRLQEQIEALEALEDPDPDEKVNLETQLETTREEKLRLEQGLAALEVWVEAASDSAGDLEDVWEDYLQEEPKLRQKFQNAANTLQIIQSLTSTHFQIGATVQATGDAVQFSFEIKRKAGLPDGAITTLETKQDPFLEIEVHGGIRVDFSTGVFFSNLKDESYVAIAPEEGETPILERRGEEESASTAAGALIHVYKKGSRIPIAASFGVATDSDNVNYYLGPSLLFGKNRRWVITGGASLGRVERLNGGLKVGRPFTGDTNNIPTEAKLRFGYFVSFSFNLGGSDE